MTGKRSAFMTQNRVPFLFLNVGHAYAHLFMLLYPTVVLALEQELQRSYGSLLALSTAGFVAFGAGALPAGWLGDRWSRHGMMTVFFLGIGLAAILTGLAQTPAQIAIGLTLIGVFASIYHPVGITLVVSGAERVGRRLGINGVWGNMGVALAALIAGALTDLVSWRAAFIVPGLLALATGAAYALFVWQTPAEDTDGKTQRTAAAAVSRQVQVRVFTVVIVATLLAGLIFHATTVAMPKVFDERLGDLTTTTLGIGGMISAIYAVAAFAQIAVGHLIDRYPLKPIFLVVVSLQVPMFLAVSALAGPAMVGGALAIMVLVFGEIPIGDTLVARHTSDAWRSRIYAAKYVLALGVSAITVPFIALVHGSGGGFAVMFTTLAGLAAVVAASTLLLPSERRRTPTPVPAGE
jgi:MFS family permease